MQTYLFYDIETTGLNKAFDQVLQFAAIRTDLQLNEISRHEFIIKLNKDIIPSPAALITHHIGIHATQDGASEIEAIKQIHQLLNTPGTISVGYNTLGFDDEFLRFSFYRNLLPPYTHQFANQCSRMDIYPFAIMYFLFKNDIISWPVKEGKTSLKLEMINTMNQLGEGQAHNAMVDVEVTLALARRFFQDERMWNYLCGFFNKTTDEKRARMLTDQTGLMIYGKIGAEKMFQAPVLFLGNHRHYKNQTLWLRLDTEELQTTTLESIAETTWAIRKKFAEPGFTLPFENQYLKHLTPERLTLVERNKNWLQQHPDILQAITHYHTEFKYPVIPETDVEARLYMNGFLTFEEERFCQQFHLATFENKLRLTEAVKNKTLKTLAIRILGRHAPHVLTPELASEFNDYLKQETVVDYRGEPRLTAKKALEQIAELHSAGNLSAVQLGLLAELENYLSN